MKESAHSIASKLFKFFRDVSVDARVEIDMQKSENDLMWLETSLSEKREKKKDILNKAEILNSEIKNLELRLLEARGIANS
jgi:hypothetical protein